MTYKPLILIIFFCIFHPGALLAQKPKTTVTCTVSGKLAGENTNEPLGYAPVVLKDSSAKIAATALTDQFGQFRIDSLAHGKYMMEITFIGYRPYRKAILLTGNLFDMGFITLKKDSTLLNEVVVTAEKSDFKLNADRKTYWVGKDILSQSGSAGDILNGIPSVSVEPSGLVRLRGNTNVTVLLNGRRSGLSLSNVLTQIPATNIEKIEIITNPSARYDAAGSAGIINIVLKKNSKKGLSGQVRAGLGSPVDYSLHANLDYQTEKLHLFTNLGGRYTNYVGLYKSVQTATTGPVATLNKVQNENRHDDGRLIYVGGDYFLNAHNTLTVAFFKNATKDIDGTALDYRYNSIRPDSSLTRLGGSREVRSYNQVEFNYTKIFDREGKKFTFDVQYDFWNSSKTWNLTTRKIFPESTELAPVRTVSDGDSRDLVLQSDLVNPFQNQSIFEIGFKLETRSVLSDFKAEYYPDTDWKIFDNIENRLDYNEKIGSTYVQFRSKPRKLSYAAGLRFEQTQIKIRDRQSFFNNKKQYGRLFPTFSLSYAPLEKSTLRASYSRRINRPSLWYLYPFNELTDFNAQFAGNPDLNPSYTNVFEITWLIQWDKLTLNPGIYAHFMDAPIQPYTYRNEAGVFITMPINLSKEKRYGTELSVIYDPIKWLSVNAQFNTFRFTQSGHYQETDFDFSNQSWNGRMNLRIKLPWKLTFQGRYDVQGAENNAQTHTKSYSYLAAGFSKVLFKEKGTLTLDGNNVLNSRKIRTLVHTGNELLDQTSNFNAARFKLTFTYRFIKNPAQTFRSQREGNRD